MEIKKPEEDQNTVFWQDEEQMEQETLYLGEDIQADEKTVGLFRQTGKVESVTGWLVCIGGEKRGVSYTLYEGRNFVGRSLKMDISLSEDLRVCRDNHFSVVYDKKSNSFYLMPGNGSVSLDGKVIRKAEPLTEDMEVTAGEGVYLFVPYCKGKRVWA